MNAQDVSPSFVVRQAELHAPVKTTRSEQGRIQCVGSVGGHENLDVASGVETIELVDKLKHRSLHLVIASCTIVEPSTSNRVDLIEKDDARLLCPRHLEELSDHPGALAHILLHQLGADDSNEGGICSVGHGSGTQRLSRPWRSIKKNTLWRVNAEVDEFLGL